MLFGSLFHVRHKGCIDGNPLTLRSPAPLESRLVTVFFFPVQNRLCACSRNTCPKFHYNTKGKNILKLYSASLNIKITKTISQVFPILKGNDK